MTNKNTYDPNNPHYRQLYIQESTSKNGKYTQTKFNEDDFLQIWVWKRMRSKRMNIDGYRCQKCGKPYDLEVHHTRYPEIWGLEDIEEDLITLCDDCHNEVHGHD